MSQYEGVNRRLRHEVRDIARKHWVSTLDQERARVLAEEEIKQRYGDILIAFIVSLLIRLAVELIVWWFKNHVLDPNPVYTADEPGYVE